MYAWGIKGFKDEGSVPCIKGVVCNGIIWKSPCTIPNVGREGSFYNVAVTEKIPNYPHAFPHTVCGDHKWIELLETLFCI